MHIRIEGESYFNQGADKASIETNRQAEIRQTQQEGKVYALIISLG